MTWYGRNQPRGLDRDSSYETGCETCIRTFAWVTEGDTGGSYPLDEDNAPNDDPVACDMCPYSHYMCGYCARDVRQRTCPEPWECDECEAPVTSHEYMDGVFAFCSERCLAVSRESELAREAS